MNCIETGLYAIGLNGNPRQAVIFSNKYESFQEFPFLMPALALFVLVHVNLAFAADSVACLWRFPSLESFFFFQSWRFDARFAS